MIQTLTKSWDSLKRLFFSHRFKWPVIATCSHIQDVLCTCLGSPFESPAADLGEYGRKVRRAEENWWIGRILTAATANYPLLCRSTIQLSDHPPHFHPRPLSIFPPHCTLCNSLTSTTRFLIESPQCVTLFAWGKNWLQNVLIPVSECSDH